MIYFQAVTVYFLCVREYRFTGDMKGPNSKYTLLRLIMLRRLEEGGFYGHVLMDFMLLFF